MRGEIVLRIDASVPWNDYRILVQHLCIKQSTFFTLVSAKQLAVETQGVTVVIASFHRRLHLFNRHNDAEKHIAEIRLTRPANSVANASQTAKLHKLILEFSRRDICPGSVSYTHLTLPTICSV